MKRISIAVDGPSAAGKGTVARGVARALDYSYLDTGAMYRSVALLALAQHIPLHDEAALAALAGSLQFAFDWDGEVLRIRVNQQDVTDHIRTAEIGAAASSVSRHARVRAALVALQQDLASHGGVVMDGRDIGTVVLPHAELKIYLDGSLDARARRRNA